MSPRKSTHGAGFLLCGSSYQRDCPQGLGTHPRDRKTGAAWQRLSKQVFRRCASKEAAARTQARIDSGNQTIVGVNKYRLEKEAPIDILEIDNTEVRKEQIERLEQLKANRDEKAVEKALR